VPGELDHTEWGRRYLAADNRAQRQLAGFREVERFEHFTNGGLHAFIRMARGTIESPA
jgi:hypothetical protein